LIKDKQHQTVEDQYLAAKETAHHIAGYGLRRDGMWPSDTATVRRSVHLRRSEIAAKAEGMHEVPLDVCGADSQARSATHSNRI
jgi:carbamate kinase